LQAQEGSVYSYFLVEKELKVISAAKEALTLASVPRYVRVITREELDRWGVRNLFELFKYLPEFYPRKSKFYLNAVGAFGLKQSYFSEKVQVFIDGIPLVDPSNGSSFSTNNNISLDNVKRVEIIYGPMTSLYGFNASLAVINLVTYSPEDLKAKVGGYLSTSGSADSYAVGSFKKGGLKGIYSFTYRKNVGPHKEYTDWSGKTENISLFSRHLTYYFKLYHKSGFYFHFYGVDRDDSFPISLVGLIVNGDHSFANRKACLNHIGFKKEEENWSVDVQAYLDWFYLKRGYNICPESFCSSLPFLDLPPLYGVEERAERKPGLSFFATYSSSLGKFSGGLEVSVIDLYKETVSANFLPSSVASLDLTSIISTFQQSQQPLTLSLPIETYPEIRLLPEEKAPLKKAERKVFSSYFQYLLMKERYGFLLNARLDRVTEVGNALSYSVAALYKLNDNARLKLNFGRAIRIPSFEEMYVRNNPLLYGNENLKFEKVDSVMPSFEFTGEKLQLKLLFYFDWIRDLIYKETLSGYAQQWANADGLVKLRGMLFSLKRALFEHMEVYCDVNRRFSYSGDGVVPTYFQFPDWKGIVGVSYDSGGMKLDVNTEFYSRISESIGGYYLLNFASRWRAGNNLSFAFEVRNILDRGVYYPATWPSKVVVDEGRSLWVGLEYSF